MIEILQILILIAGPIIGAILLGFIQLGIYTLLAKIGLVKLDNIPVFPILLFRGLLILLGIIALASFASLYFKGDDDYPLAIIPQCSILPLLSFVGSLIHV